MIIIQRCCFPKKQDNTVNDQNQEIDVKNSEENSQNTNLKLQKNSNSKRDDNKSSNRYDIQKTDIINLDRPTNSNNSNFFSTKNEKFNYIDNNNKLNGFDVKNSTDFQKTPNMKGKQEDISIVDLLNGVRVITESEIKNAPTLTIEVI